MDILEHGKLGTWIFGAEDIRTWTAGHIDIWGHGHLRTWAAGHMDICGHLNLRKRTAGHRLSGGMDIL
jgi:hypothetical protein